MKTYIFILAFFLGTLYSSFSLQRIKTDRDKTTSSISIRESNIIQDDFSLFLEEYDTDEDFLDESIFHKNQSSNYFEFEEVTFQKLLNLRKRKNVLLHMDIPPPLT